MNRYGRYYRKPYDLYEADDDVVLVDDDEYFDDEDDFDIDDEIEIVEDSDVESQLSEIADNLGYNFTSSDGRGSFSVSDNVEVSVRFTQNLITSLDVRILKNPARFSCLKNTTTVDNLSVELQTCVLIIKEIRSKLKVRS
jgi:hypothetical protein